MQWRVLITIIFTLLVGLFTYAEDATTTPATSTSPTPNPPSPITSTRGVVSCDGARLAQIGLVAPTVSQFVPVWDQAVALNTNMILYKECVLDAINNQLKQAYIASVVKNAVEAITGKKTGKPQFVTDLKQYLEERKQKRLNKIFNEGELNSVCSPFKDVVVDALKKSFEEVKKPFACSIEQAQLENCRNGNIKDCGGMENFYKYVLNPTNNPIFAYYRAQSYIQQQLQEEETNERTQLLWGRGFAPKRQEETITLDDGTVVKKEVVVTPGYLIAQYASQIVGTGLRQLETADELNEIVGALMQQLGNTILTGSGFTGLAVSTYGGATYLDYLNDETAGGVTGAYANALLQQVISALSNTNNYINAVLAYLSEINKQELNLRANELACLEGANGVIANAKREFQKYACEKLYATTTCPVAVDVQFAKNDIETFEKGLGKVAGAFFMPKSDPAQVKYRINSYDSGYINVTTAKNLFGEYKFESDGFSIATSTVPNGNISVYARQGSLSTTRGTFKFSKEEVGVDGFKQYVLKFIYDLPDVVLSATNGGSTVQMTLLLEKKYTQSAINDLSDIMGYNKKKEYYTYLSALYKYRQDLLWAKSVLENNPTDQDMQDVQNILSVSTDVQQAFIIADQLQTETQNLKNAVARKIESWKEETETWNPNGTKTINTTWCGPTGIKTSFCAYIANQAIRSQIGVCNQ